MNKEDQIIYIQKFIDVNAENYFYNSEALTEKEIKNFVLEEQHEVFNKTNTDTDFINDCIEYLNNNNLKTNKANIWNYVKNNYISIKPENYIN